jgi:hypothetical protein
VEEGGEGRKCAAEDGGDRRERAVVRSDREREPRKAIVGRRERARDFARVLGFLVEEIRETSLSRLKRAFSVRKIVQTYCDLSARF